MKKNILFLGMYIGIVGLFLYKTTENNRHVEGFPIELIGDYPDKTVIEPFDTKAKGLKEGIAPVPDGEPKERKAQKEATPKSEKQPPIEARTIGDILPNGDELSKNEIIDEAELLLSSSDAQKNSDGLFILNGLASEHNARANYLLAQLYEKGIRVPEDADKALSFYKVAALNGSDDANIYMFNYYLDSELTTNAHYQEALGWFSEATDNRKNPIADYGLAYMYEIGLGTEPDQAQAIAHYKKSVQNSFVLAYERLADLYLSSNNAKNIEEALLLFQRAANADIPSAQFKLGHMYKEGLGTRQDLETARFWYQKAANHDVSLALVALGNLYAEGRGVEMDNKRAYDYYRMAAEKNDAIAQAMVARFFERGIGIEKDLNRALFWYTKAAEQGDAVAQYNLGRILEEYEEIHNVDGAKKWYSKAEEAGIAEAKTALERLAKQ